MKLSEWAKEKGICYKTAWRMFHDGRLPVPAEQLPTGTIVITMPLLPEDRIQAAIYARVSSSDQRSDLDGQVERLRTFAESQNLSVVKVVAEIGSGLNARRRKLLGLLADPSIGIILVEHRDRLMRFGSEFVEASLAAQGRQILIADDEELKDDLVQDMISLLTCFCARLYGRRSARNRAEKAMEAMSHEGQKGTSLRA